MTTSSGEGQLGEPLLGSIISGHSPAKRDGKESQTYDDSCRDGRERKQQ